MEILINRVRRAMDGQPVTTEYMFGGLTFLLNGNMLCSVSKKGLMARVGADAGPSALTMPHATACLGAGRRMAGFILVDHAGIATDAELTAWLHMALAYVAQLPAKVSKPSIGRTKRQPKSIRS